MKRIVFVLFVTISSFTYGQKFAFVDTEYILSNIPSYEAAQDQLNEISKEYQKEIENSYQEIEKLYKSFQAEKVLLSDAMATKRENEIIEKEKAVKDKQKKYFGKDGDVFKKRQELIKPIQDEVFNAVKEIAVEGSYAVIYDIAANPSMLYTDPKHDKSDDVLSKLGFKK